MKRKYRGAQRIAPIREKASAALARGDEEAEALVEAAREYAAAGFKVEAKTARDELDQLLGIERCPDCGSILGRNDQPWMRDFCPTCARASERKKVAKLSRGKRRALKSRIARLRDRPILRRTVEENQAFPWVAVTKRHRAHRRRPRYRLQRSWAHLAKQLPDFNRIDTWTEEDRKLHHRLIREENARRKARA